jgi:uncharacterized protein (TIGR00251 family)
MTANENTPQSSVELQEHAEGIVVPVRANPGSRRNGVTGVREGCLCIAVTAPADRGKANNAIAKLLAKSLGISPSRVKLLTGATSRQKRLLVLDVELSLLASQLTRIVDEEI